MSSYALNSRQQNELADLLRQRADYLAELVARGVAANAMHMRGATVTMQVKVARNADDPRVIEVEVQEKIKAPKSKYSDLNSWDESAVIITYRTNEAQDQQSIKFPVDASQAQAVSQAIQAADQFAFEQISGRERVDGSTIGKTTTDLSGLVLDRVVREAMVAGTLCSVSDFCVYDAGGRPHLVTEQRKGVSEDLYFALPLYENKEWTQLHGDEYGPTTESYDEYEPTRSRRQLGGELNGRSVKLGKKKLYIGPFKDALVIACNLRQENEETPDDDAECDDGK